MNFKLSFLCILFVNLLPQSFASPKNLGSRRADDLAAKVKQLEEGLKSLRQQLKEKVNLKSNKPPSKTTTEEEERTLSTKEKALTTSPSTPSKNNATTRLVKHLTNNTNVDNTTLYSLTTPSTAPLSPSSSSDKTTVTTSKTAAANKEAKAASSNPVTHAAVNSKADDLVDEVKQLKEEVKSLHQLLMKEKDNLKSNEPPSKTTEEERTLSTKEKALTTSPSTPSKNNAIKSLLNDLTNNTNTTWYPLTTQNKTAPLSPSSSSDNTTVTTNKTAAANIEAKAASSNPVTHAAVNSKDQKTPSTEKAERRNPSHFPTIFMVLLVIVVVTYMIYHNRNKVHNFIKKDLSGNHESSVGYVKVKVEDDLDLPRDANRHYIY
ncbi:bromodomain-containing protein DDB_G0270170-like isoform X1 [Acropora muricata]|uniref:bromodomain-containing protein DDB_G0270170-like isoform X1 n=1 Tax=Acropora muricata TaxID=159855 RepID=UPI0034E58C8B